MSATNLEQREFNIYGNKVVFYDLLLNTAYILNKLKGLEKHYTDLIHDYYIGIGKLDGFMKKADELLYEAQLTFFQTTVAELKKRNCDAGKDIRSFFSYPKELSYVYEFWEELNSYYAEETNYIPQKRWVGGGFGVTGAIKGAITAGAFNAVGNFIGSIKHSSEIARHNVGVDRAKKKFYKEKGFEETFKYSISYLSEMAEVAFKSELLAIYDYDVYENINYEVAAEMCFNMVNNPEKITSENIAKTLQACPYLPDTYMLALNNLQGDTTELGLLYGFCIRDDVFDTERKRKNEILLNINSGKFSSLLHLYKEDKSIVTQIKDTVFEEYKYKAIEIFQEALGGGDISKVEDMQAFVEIMKNDLNNWELFYLAGKIYEERKYGVGANLEKSIEYYRLAVNSNNVKIMDRLAYLCRLTDKNVEAEKWAKKALSLSPELLSAKITLGVVLNEKLKTSVECEEAIKLYSELSELPYSQFEGRRTPAYFCYCAAKIYDRKDEWGNEKKRIEWLIKGAKIEENKSKDSWGVTCCGAAIPLLQKHYKFKQAIELCLLYKGRYMGADWLLGFAYCRGHQVPKDYNKGAECFLSVINNYNELNDKIHQDKRNSAQIALNKMVCKNGIWKKKMFESI